MSNFSKFLVYFSLLKSQSQVSANKPQLTDVPKVNTTYVIAQIEPDVCSRVTENWNARIRAITRSRGDNLYDDMIRT